MVTNISWVILGLGFWSLFDLIAWDWNTYANKRGVLIAWSDIFRYHIESRGAFSLLFFMIAL